MPISTEPQDTLDALARAHRQLRICLWLTVVNVALAICILVLLFSI